jgi:hypothetical protein
MTKNQKKSEELYKIYIHVLLIIQAEHASEINDL